MLYLQELDLYEVELLLEVMNKDEKFCKKLGLSGEDLDITELEASDLLEAFDEYARLTNSLMFTILDEDNEIIGTASLNQINHKQSNCNINYTFVTGEYSMTRSAILHDLLIEQAYDLGLEEIIEVATPKTVSILNSLNYCYTAEPMTMNTLLLKISPIKDTLALGTEKDNDKIYH